MEFRSLVEPGAAQRREQREREKNVEAQQDDEEYKPKQFCTLGKKVLYSELQLFLFLVLPKVSVTILFKQFVFIRGCSQLLFAVHFLKSN